MYANRKELLDIIPISKDDYIFVEEVIQHLINDEKEVALL